MVQYRKKKKASLLLIDGMFAKVGNPTGAPNKRCVSCQKIRTFAPGPPQGINSHLTTAKKKVKITKSIANWSLEASN